MAISIVWFRNDLRLADNPAVTAALASAEQVIPIFILSHLSGANPPGGASRWWLHHSLTRLADELKSWNVPLILQQGDPLEILAKIAHKTGATQLFFNRQYETSNPTAERDLIQTLKALPLHVKTFNSSLIFDPAIVTNRSGKPFQVFSAMWKSCYPTVGRLMLLPKPKHWPAYIHPIASDPLDSWGLLPKIKWDTGIRKTWTPGEAGAQAMLTRFQHHAQDDYQPNRDRPDIEGTSRLSPYLHFGEISPQQVWHTVQVAVDVAAAGPKKSAETYLKELGWREFAYHLLYHFPHTVNQPLRADYADFPWRDDLAGLQAWQHGHTGYPIVDAGIRQLWHTGWMHNRVRMIVGSFLTKDLLLPWQLGSDWFWDTLVDADLASNTLGWQWVAGCGADASPFFRIFNPILQGKKFDPKGDYIRRWLPELAGLDAHFIHTPWEAPPLMLHQANIRLGTTYPEPIVDHFFARDRALEVFKKLRKTTEVS